MSHFNVISLFCRTEAFQVYGAERYYIFPESALQSSGQLELPTFNHYIPMACHEPWIALGWPILVLNNPGPMRYHLLPPANEVSGKVMLGEGGVRGGRGGGWHAWDTTRYGQ